MIVEEKDILEFIMENNKVTGLAINGSKLKEEELKSLKSDADVIAGTRLWNLLSDRTIYAARIRSCDNAKDFNDVVEARGALWAVSMFEQILQTLKSK